MKGLTVALTGVALCAAGQLRAAEWSYAPRMLWGVDHNSNRLFIENGPESQSANLQLDLLLRRATPTTAYTLQPRASWQRYTDNIYQDSNAQSLTAAGFWLMDRSSVSATAMWARDDTLNNEIEDTGAFTGSSRRKSLSGGLTWSAQLSRRNTFQTQANYSDIKYTNDTFFDFFGFRIPIRRLFGYRYPSLNAVESFQWSDRTSLTFSAYGAKLLSDDRPDSDSYGADIGIKYALTDRLQLTFSGGMSLQSSEDSDETGYLGRLELLRTGKLGTWRLFAKRSVQPSGYGLLTTQDEAGLVYDQRLTPRLSTSLAARVLRSEDITLGNGEQNRRYDRVEASLSWVATRSWQIRGATSFLRGKRVQTAPMETGWSAQLQAIWAPQRDWLSR